MHGYSFHRKLFGFRRIFRFIPHRKNMLLHENPGSSDQSEESSNWSVISNQQWRENYLKFQNIKAWKGELLILLISTFQHLKTEEGRSECDNLCWKTNCPFVNSTRVQYISGSQTMVLVPFVALWPKNCGTLPLFLPDTFDAKM